MVTRIQGTAATGGREVAPPASDKNGSATIHVPADNSSGVRPLASLPVRKMVEREAPEMVEFKAHGDFIEGRLLAPLKIKIKDKKTLLPKPVMEYTLVGADGKSRKCLGSYDLDTKIRPTDEGIWTEIAYVDDKDVGQPVKMRIFKVSFEERISTAAAFEDGTQITDEDIPF